MNRWTLWLLRRADGLRHRFRKKKMNASRALGAKAEDLAHRYLQERGYQIVARNWRPRSGRGEIDLVAWEKGRLVFVEVKARTSDAYGTPDRAVDAIKRAALHAAGSQYALWAGFPPAEARYDLVTVVMDEGPRIELRQGAYVLRGPHAVC